MVYNKIGQSGLYVSRICLGTMAFGGLCDEKESFRIMDEAGLFTCRGLTEAVEKAVGAAKEGQ